MRGGEEGENAMWTSNFKHDKWRIIRVIHQRYKLYDKTANLVKNYDNVKCVINSIFTPKWPLPVYLTYVVTEMQLLYSIIAIIHAFLVNLLNILVICEK